MTVNSKTNNMRIYTRTANAAFSLIELMVVVGLIGLILAIIVPSATSAIRDSRHAQAISMLSSNISLARTEAMVRNDYVGVHVGLSDRPKVDADGFEDKSYISLVTKDVTNLGATMELKTLSKSVTRRDGDGSTFTEETAVYSHQDLPTPHAAGELSDKFVTDTGFKSILNNSTDSDNDGRADIIEDFTTFTVLFSPQGKIVTPTITYANSDLLWGGTPTVNNDLLWTSPTPSTPINEAVQPERAVRAVTVFDYMKLRYTDNNITFDGLSGTGKQGYLDKNAEFITFNSYTGQHFRRK